VRRYNFLITLAITAYFAYICAPPNYGRYVTMEMSGHRPLYNSAFTASLTQYFEASKLVFLMKVWGISNSPSALEALRAAKQLSHEIHISNHWTGF
jgi:hypothetical protein